jgi:Amt family ammonium transporter
MKKLTMSEKFSRLRARLQDREWRRYGTLLLVGKLTGIALLLIGVMLFNPSLLGLGALAAEPTVAGNDIVNPLNTMWTLIAAFLVFGMQVGFTMLEAGFCRSRETVNVLMECIVDTCLCGLLFFAFGFAFMFSHGNGFIGYNWFFLQGAPATYEASGVAFLAFWLFQFAFADTCSTITSGAMIGVPGLSATSSIASGFRVLFIRSSDIGPGVRMVFWQRWEAREISSPRSV